MKLRQLPIIIVLVALTGCGALGQLTKEERAVLTPSAKVFAIQTEMNTLLQQINVYAAQPFCTVELIVACADRQVVITANTIAQRTAAAVRAAQGAVKAGAPETAVLAAGARTALAQLSGYLITRGISQ